MPHWPSNLHFIFFCMQMEDLFLSIYRFETYLQRANLCKSIFPPLMLPFRILRLRFRIPGNGFPVSLLVELGFWILIVSRIPDSLSCIPDSKTQGFGFHKQRLSTDFEIQIPLPGATIVSVDRDQRKDCSLSLSLLPKFSLFFCWNSCFTNHPHFNIISQSSGFPPPFSHRGIKLRELRQNTS